MYTRLISSVFCVVFTSAAVFVRDLLVSPSVEPPSLVEDAPLQAPPQPIVGRQRLRALTDGLVESDLIGSGHAVASSGPAAPEDVAASNRDSNAKPNSMGVQKDDMWRSLLAEIDGVGDFAAYESSLDTELDSAPTSFNFGGASSTGDFRAGRSRGGSIRRGLALLDLSRLSSNLESESGIRSTRSGLGSSLFVPVPSSSRPGGGYGGGGSGAGGSGRGGGNRFAGSGGSSAGGGGSIGSSSGGGGGASGTGGRTSQLIDQVLNNPGFNQRLQNGSFNTAGANSSSVGSSSLASTNTANLLAFDPRTQLTADGKFGIPNHQYWGFDFIDHDGINGVDRADARISFTNYLNALDSLLVSEQQVVRFDRNELEASFDQLSDNAQEKIASNSYLSFMIIDFPVKAFTNGRIPDTNSFPSPLEFNGSLNLGGDQFGNLKVINGQSLPAQDSALPGFSQVE